MKKVLLYILITAFLAVSFVGCANQVNHEVVVVPLPVEDRMAMIDASFALEDFEGVKTIYDEAVGEDKEIIEKHIEGYALLYIDAAKQQLSTKALEDFKRTGYSGSVLIDGIDLIERLIVSDEAYKEGKIAYNGRDFVTAKEKLAAIDPEYSNYATAQECLAEIERREQAWQTPDFGRSQGTYALAGDEEFIYMSYEYDGVFGILKVSADTEYTEFIPLSDSGDYVITGINIIGDYIYFIAGDNVGRGLMFDNPYCIYEMKTDGSGLALVRQGDYFDLIIHESQVLALSYTKGLVELDQSFSNETVLSDKRVIEMCDTDKGLFYTVQGSLGSNSKNEVYLYDGESHKAYASGSFVHYYPYPQNALKLQSTGSTNEVLYLETADSEKKITSTDILKVYGVLGGRVIYSTPGNDAQERLRDYDITSGSGQAYTDSNELPEFYITGLSYETDQIFAVNTDGIYVMEPGFQNQKQLELPELNGQDLEKNKALLRHISDADLYSPEEPQIAVISDEQLWYYSDSSLNIVMEKRFLEETECTAYITHIYTNDFSLITTDTWEGKADSRSTAEAEDIAKKYGIIYGQSSDYFNYNDETRRGIVIRKGEVYRDYLYNNMLAIYPDGTFVTYEKGDTITADRLIEDGVMTSLCFGPVLVKDGFLSSSAPHSKVAVRNPRSAIGMVAPGHYVSIIVDGRNSQSRGLTTVALGELFADEGCKVAYNLDGGGTVSVTFLGNFMELKSNYRRIPDMLYFGSSDSVPVDLDEFTMTYEQYTSSEKEMQE